MAQFWSEPLTRQTLPEFFNEFAEAAYSYIYSIVGDEAATEKLVEDAFVRVYRQRKRLQPNQLVLVLGAELDKASGAQEGAAPAFEPATPDVACMARMLNHILHKADSIVGGWGPAIGGGAAAVTAAAVEVSGESQGGEGQASQAPDGEPDDGGAGHEGEIFEEETTGFPPDEAYDYEEDGLPPEGEDELPPLPPGDGGKRRKLGILLLVLLFLLGGTAIALALTRRTPASNPQTLTSPPEMGTTTPAGVILTATPTMTTVTPTVTQTPTSVTTPTVPTQTTTTKAGGGETDETKKTTKAGTKTTTKAGGAVTTKATTKATTKVTTTAPVTEPATTTTTAPVTEPATTTTTTTTPAPTTPAPTTPPVPQYSQPAELPQGAQDAYTKALKGKDRIAYDEVAGTYRLVGTQFFWDTETVTGPEGGAQLFCLAADGVTRFAVNYDPATGTVYTQDGTGQRIYYDPQGNVIAGVTGTPPLISGWFYFSAVDGNKYEYTHAQTGQVIVYEGGSFTDKQTGDPYTMPGSDPYLPDDQGSGVLQPRYDAQGALYWHNTHDGVDFKAVGDGTWQRLNGDAYTPSLPEP
jgi:hypothetical protein